MSVSDAPGVTADQIGQVNITGSGDIYVDGKKLGAVPRIEDMHTPQLEAWRSALYNAWARLRRRVFLHPANAVVLITMVASLYFAFDTLAAFGKPDLMSSVRLQWAAMAAMIVSLLVLMWVRRDIHAGMRRYERAIHAADSELSRRTDRAWI